MPEFLSALNQQINGSSQDMASLMIRVIAGKLRPARYADRHMFLTFTVFTSSDIMKYTKRIGSLQSSFLFKTGENYSRTALSKGTYDAIITKNHICR